jgi:hypothetical protein
MTYFNELGQGRVGFRTPSSGGNTPPLITNGLILNLDASNPTSYQNGWTTFVDLSPTLNNGILTNGVGYSPSNGGYLTFDGINDYVNMESNSAFNLVNISISIWVKLDTTASNNFIAGRYYNTNIENGWIIYYNPTTQKIIFGGRESSAVFIGNQSINSYNVNTWYNLVFTKSSNTWSIYANGSLDMNQNNGVGNVAFSLNNMQFGGTIQSYGSNYGKNSIGSVHIYNRALSNSEVLQNFNATKTRFGL